MIDKFKLFFDKNVFLRIITGIFFTIARAVSHRLDGRERARERARGGFVVRRRRDVARFRARRARRAAARRRRAPRRSRERRPRWRARAERERERHRRGVRSNDGEWAIEGLDRAEIGRAACRERV